MPAPSVLCRGCGRPLLPIDPAFDLARRDLVVAGDRRHVRETAWRILMYLAHRCGRLVRRAELQEEIWPCYRLDPPDPRGIDVQIYQLRRLLAGSGWRIVTVTGAGWIFDGYDDGGEPAWPRVPARRVTTTSPASGYAPLSSSIG